MKERNYSLIWGGLLVLGGLAMLLRNFGIVDFGLLWSGIWALLFAVGGVAFLWVFLQNQEQWWALIPGFVFLGLATMLGLQLVAPTIGDIVGAPIFLGAIGLGFWAIYLVQREQWWAIIPGGVLFSVALMVLVGSVWPDSEPVGILFFGMAATFALVAVLPNPHGRMTWGFIPAGILFLIGLFIGTPFIEYLSLLGPLALIAGGGYLVFRMLRTPKDS